MKKSYFLICLISIVSYNLAAQVSIKDSSIATPMISASYGYYLPGGDMGERFGGNSSVQLGVDFKTKSNWTFGVNGSYLFGKTIKVSLFDSIANKTGYIVNKLGESSDIRLFERGFTFSGTVGRLFAFKKPNPNSGILVSIGLGFIQHKIRIETIGNNTPQLSKEYKKGYDHLTNGFLLSENVGYLYLSNNRLTNLYVGLECMQGFTQSRRSWDFMEMRADTEKRLDLLFGLKASWILPTYKKAPQEFYNY